MVELIPSILTSNPEEARDILQEVSRSGKFGRVQVDFVDGKYANNLTIKPKVLDLRLGQNLKFDAHLMVTEGNIKSYFEDAREMGYDRIIAQLESISHPELFKGLAIDIHSPLSAVEPYLDKIEVVVVMSVEPGYGGQKFVESAIDKVVLLNNLRKARNLNFRVCVDGGVNKIHLGILENAGANEVVMGAKKVLEW